VDQAIAAHGKIVYLLTGDPENCELMIQKILAAGKVPIVNLDLLNGFSRDRYAVNYLKRAGTRGIISTHLEPLRHALSIGLYAIQRTFLLDSGAMDTITSQLKNTPVDALEAMPALVAPKILERVRVVSPDLPVVGGGLIQTMKEVEDLLSQGLSAVSVSNPQMWIS
jgi:glycerol uptake operon antiterminator